MRNHIYICRKGWPESYKDKEIGWTCPTTVAEALAAGPDTAGKAFFPDEKTLVQYAVAQLNIKKGHTAMAGLTAEEGKEPEVKSLADAVRVAQVTVASTVTRTVGGATASAKKQKAVAEKISTNISTFAPDKLAFLVEIGQLSQAEVDAEVARRKTPAPAPSAKAPKSPK